jgi:hypothetical protein
MSSSSFCENSGKKTKERRTPAARKKSAARKMVRDILLNVVDSVQDESARKRAIVESTVTTEKTPVAPPLHLDNPWKKGPPVAGQSKKIAAASDVDTTAVRTMRDIVVGKSTMAQKALVDAGGSVDRWKGPPKIDGTKTTNSVINQNSGPDSPKKGLGQPPFAKKHDATQISPRRSPTENVTRSVASTESPSKENPPKGTKGKGTTTADQNTAPTYQETVSAMSGASNRRSKRLLTKVSQTEPNKSDSSSGGTDEAPQNRERESASATVDKDTVSGPPLLTLVSPENANSATSSVASSLEVPHTSRRHHHSLSTPDTGDVGCHLLDVCDRLSRDMSLFMNSLGHAVNVRRRERVAVLTALQDSLSSVWPGMCKVEMYGSCATMLDLPSSDLDVVVVGLDHSERILAGQMQQQQQQKGKKSNTGGGKHRRSNSKDGSREDPSISVHHGPFVPQLSPYRNSERVKQLSKQIEGQSWAVQVKCLPNASVPVIKILADPSKLPVGTGAESTSLALGTLRSPGDTATDSKPITVSPSDSSTVASLAQPSQNLYEPWRGSDVMNGLISLDITFEGPEHGGLSSTEFSLQVVAEACEQSGSPPESTPFVQCLMVLKELLVQRKLNEPYSGGLSRYALLLLLLALVRERALIRQEIERVEIQRQAMADGGVSSYAGALVGSMTSEEVPPSIFSKSNVSKDTANSTETSTPAPAVQRTQSWANIAKNPSVTPTPSVSSERPAKNPKPKAKLNRPASFADAVARSTATSSVNSESYKIEPQGESYSSLEPQTPGASTITNSPALDEPAATDPNNLAVPSFYPQGFDDVIEVLCSGETTAGKLLMHFLLYYGQYFDAQTTAIDLSGKHERAFAGHQQSPYSYLSPYIQRRAPETIDPHTGMLVVDPIVVYDPLPGAENSNVARRCFAWQQVKWIFSQSYSTLSSAVERSSSPLVSPGTRPTTATGGVDNEICVRNESHSGDLIDPSSPLLRCLLSF